jgi:hypothetical protein
MARRLRRWFISDRPNAGADAPLEGRPWGSNAPMYEGMPRLSPLGAVVAIVVFLALVALFLRLAG